MGGRLAAVAALALAGACASAPTAEPNPPAAAATSSGDGVGLTGRLLVAQPIIRDPLLAKVVILVVQHDRGGAVGVVVNRASRTRSAAELARQLGGAVSGDGTVAVRYGGPVAAQLGFLVYSPPGQAQGERVVTPSIAVGFEMAVLERIAAGDAPPRAFFAFGHVGWGPGQLEAELGRGGWAVVPVDDEIVFDEDMDSKWRRAMLAGQREAAPAGARR